MLEVKNVDIMISTRYLIESLSFTLNKGDKLAIIGEEGNGKSTLLKSLLGICDYAEVSGIINFKGNTVGYLEQSLNGNDLNKKVFDYLFHDDYDYYNKVNEFYKYLENLKIDDYILNQTMSNLSGGERVKISILKLLLNRYDILFLDEPTNDLDIETLEWLSTFINKTSKPIIYISHDETLLSDTANMILHIEQLKKKRIEIQRIFYLYYNMDFTIKELAMELNLSESYIKNCLYRTLKELQKYMGKVGNEDV